MGKGDLRTRRGKLNNNSFGNPRANEVRKAGQREKVKLVFEAEVAPTTKVKKADADEAAPAETIETEAQAS